MSCVRPPASVTLTTTAILAVRDRADDMAQEQPRRRRADECVDELAVAAADAIELHLRGGTTLRDLLDDGQDRDFFRVGEEKSAQRRRHRAEIRGRPRLPH